MGDATATRGCEAEAVGRSVRAWRELREGGILREFAEFLSIPNDAGATGVGGVGPMVANASWLKRAFERRGMRAEVWGVPGEAGAAPAVFAELDVGAARTVGLYAHYDGQPAGGGWTVGPWSPTLFAGKAEDGAARLAMPADGERVSRDCRMYARSSADDKAPVVALSAALDALGAAGVRPSVNLKVLVEGEEEITSPNLPGHIERHAAALGGCDVWLFCDGSCDTFGERMLAFGVRGDIEVELCVWGPTHEVHSGHFGNVAINPAAELAGLLGSVRDERGRMAIEGFDAAGGACFDEEERRAMREAEGLGERMLGFLGMGELDGDASEGYFERLLRPSFNVRGLHSAGVGKGGSGEGGGSRNVVPAWARASVDIRSASGAHPGVLVDLFEAHARRRGFWVIDRERTAAERRERGRILTVTRDCGYPASRTAMGSAAARAVTRAVERASSGFDGGRVYRVPMLGSSMPMHAFASGLGAPVIVTPMANADSNQHSADENLRVGHLWYGIEMLACLLRMEWEGV